MFSLLIVSSSSSSSLLTRHLSLQLAEKERIIREFVGMHKLNVGASMVTPLSSVKNRLTPHTVTAIGRFATKFAAGQAEPRHTCWQSMNSQLKVKVEKTCIFIMFERIVLSLGVRVIEEALVVSNRSLQALGTPGNEMKGEGKEGKGQSTCTQHAAYTE
jgi:hypothetical protein